MKVREIAHTKHLTYAPNPNKFSLYLSIYLYMYSFEHIILNMCCGGKLFTCTPFQGLGLGDKQLHFMVQIGLQDST